MSLVQRIRRRFFSKTSSSRKPGKDEKKISPLNRPILEAIAAQLSDDDLVKFMKSGKESFQAALDMLSTVYFVCCIFTRSSLHIEFVRKGGIESKVNKSF